MSRAMRRFKQALSQGECKEILGAEPRGVLSVIGDDGYPYGVPMNFYYDEAENRIYFHCAKVGHKLDAIKSCSKVCFTTWDKGLKEADDWAWHVRSVIVMGQAALVEDSAVIEEKVRQLALKYYPTPEEVEMEISRDIHRMGFIALDIRQMTGKRVKEK
ncbi:pyridoxamine 5'-phosphate oxidase family protein [Eubacterium aggregans]|uniref:pyridoxamine 5'-phosphate oxidase family protein n=1 Tax=Eubacterium aggregans TaxID=81409 RepID=UPI0023F59371|nr:pyridoxamine 5'-phosphate oxidase family protein [Eubacterium aggregans]MDD4692677.1 pyridoxamine 5'-phosphate oxidase family protein [Eubacterium aggregans]